METNSTSLQVYLVLYCKAPFISSYRVKYSSFIVLRTSYLNLDYFSKSMNYSALHLVTLAKVYSSSTRIGTCTWCSSNSSEAHQV